MLSSKERASSAVSTGVLPLLREYLGPRTAWAGFSCQDLAGDQPVKQDAKSRQVLLDGSRGQLALQALNESSDVDRLHLGELADAVLLTPGRKAAGGVEVGAAGVGVIDLGGEELQHALCCLWGGRKKGSGLLF